MCIRPWRPNPGLLQEHWALLIAELSLSLKRKASVKAHLVTSFLLKFICLVSKTGEYWVQSEESTWPKHVCTTSNLQAWPGSQTLCASLVYEVLPTLASLHHILTSQLSQVAHPGLWSSPVCSLVPSSPAPIPRSNLIIPLYTDPVWWSPPILPDHPLPNPQT